MSKINVNIHGAIRPATKEDIKRMRLARLRLIQRMVGTISTPLTLSSCGQDGTYDPRYVGGKVIASECRNLNRLVQEAIEKVISDIKRGLEPKWLLAGKRPMRRIVAVYDA